MGTAWFAVFGALVIVFQVRRLPFVIINFCLKVFRLFDATKVFSLLFKMPVIVIVILSCVIQLLLFSLAYN